MRELRLLGKITDQFHANSGLIFLRFAEVRFVAQHAKLEKSTPSSSRGSLDRNNLPKPDVCESLRFLGRNRTRNTPYILNQSKMGTTIDSVLKFVDWSVLISTIAAWFMRSNR